MEIPDVELTRELRFFLPQRGGEPPQSPILNSWAAWPTSSDLAPFLALRCTIRGPIDPRTDYVCNIKHVDRLLRERAILPAWSEPEPGNEPRTPMQLLQSFWQRIVEHVPRGTTLSRLQLCVSPFLSFTIEEESHPMIYASQQFEFSASHQLHHDGLSDEENKQLYGKCTNPHGHGHNYVLEVTLEMAPEHAAKYGTTQTEQIVKSKVIDRLDHRHLNLEVPPFDRLNPTVENIAHTIWGWLEPEFRSPTRLSRVRVYETPKTWADYCGPRQ
jgi:6-pyruvoyltetrahydropterin/6-carboxytetrahydropterin synthase